MISRIQAEQRVEPITGINAIHVMVSVEKRFQTGQVNVESELNEWIFSLS
jgi:hypothetical protein